METKDNTKFKKENKLGKWCIKVSHDNRQELLSLRDKGLIWSYWDYNSYEYYHFNNIEPSHGKSIYELPQRGYKVYTIESLIEALKIQEIPNNKQIIGYKLIKPEYKEAALIISGTKGNWENSLMEYDISMNQKNYIQKLKNAQVFEKWFEAVYEKPFKVGDWVIWNENFDNPYQIIRLDINRFYVKHENFEHVYPNELGKSYRKLTEEEIKKYVDVKKTLTIGTSSIKVEVSKGKIVAEGKTIDADNLSKLVHDMNGSKQYNLPWNVGFGGSVNIGCSAFKQGELNSVLEAYDEINNTSFALLPF